MKPPHLSLTVWMLLALALGALTGLVFGELTAVLAPIGTAFIRIWQITILPTVVLSLIVGIASLERETARAIAVKAGMVLLLLWAIGVLAFFSFQLAFPAREAGSFYSAPDQAGSAGVDLIDLFIPSNPFASLAEGWIPAIVVFCLFFGFALMLDDGRGPILGALRVAQGALFRMTRILSVTFPIGAFFIMARTAGTMTLEGFLDREIYVISVVAAAILLGLVVLPLLITCVTTFRYREILAASSEAVLLALTTGSELITLPLISQGVGALFGGRAAGPEDPGAPDDAVRADDPSGVGARKNDAEDVETFSDILVPVGFTFPLLGQLAPFLFILFAAWLYQTPLDLAAQVQLAAVGIPTFFGSSKVAVIALLDLMHLPADAYSLYISSGILRLGFASALTAMSIFTFSVVSIALVTHRARLRWRRVAVSVPVVLLLAALMLVGLKMGFAQILAAASHEDDLLSRIELPLAPDGSRLDEAVNTTVYLRPEDVPAPVDRDAGGGDAGTRIRETGVLRVGYNGNPVPFAFFNGKGDLVGYDVEMAYDLARAMNVTRIEFVPVTPGTLAASLDSGYCDLVMSSVIVTPERLNEMKFTDPYIPVHMSFVVPDGRKEEFVRLEAVREMDGLRVAVFNGTVLAGEAERLLPKATIVPIDSLEEFFGERRADALFVAAEEGYPVTMSYPFYDVAVIEPGDAVPVMYAYPVARNSTESYLMALNYWLRTEREYGKLERKYEYWVLGNIPGLAPPRWSVVRDVLHWVD